MNQKINLNINVLTLVKLRKDNPELYEQVLQDIKKVKQDFTIKVGE